MPRLLALERGCDLVPRHLVRHRYLCPKCRVALTVVWQHAQYGASALLRMAALVLIDEEFCSTVPHPDPQCLSAVPESRAVGKFLNGYLSTGKEADPYLPRGWTVHDALSTNPYVYIRPCFALNGAPEVCTSVYQTDLLQEKVLGHLG